MGRFFGRRPDPTPAVRRALRGRVLPADEDVLAGVYVQRPGTDQAARDVATSAAIGSSTGIHGATFSTQGGAAWDRWAQDAVGPHQAGAAAHRSAIWFVLAVTTKRLVLVRRSRLTRRPRDIFAAWPLTDVDRIVVPRGSSTLRIVRGETELLLELPLAHKFLPEVYRELPAILDRARAEVAGAPEGPEEGRGAPA